MHSRILIAAIALLMLTSFVAPHARASDDTIRTCNISVGYPYLVLETNQIREKFSIGCRSAVLFSYTVKLWEQVDYFPDDTLASAHGSKLRIVSAGTLNHTCPTKVAIYHHKYYATGVFKDQYGNTRTIRTSVIHTDHRC